MMNAHKSSLYVFVKNISPIYWLLINIHHDNHHIILKLYRIHYESKLGDMVRRIMLQLMFCTFTCLVPLVNILRDVAAEKGSKLDTQL